MFYVLLVATNGPEALLKEALIEIFVVFICSWCIFVFFSLALVIEMIDRAIWWYKKTSLLLSLHSKCSLGILAQHRRTSSTGSVCISFRPDVLIEQECRQICTYLVHKLYCLVESCLYVCYSCSLCCKAAFSLGLVAKIVLDVGVLDCTGSCQGSWCSSPTRWLCTCKRNPH